MFFLFSVDISESPTIRPQNDRPIFPSRENPHTITPADLCTTRPNLNGLQSNLQALFPFRMKNRTVKLRSPEERAQYLPGNDFGSPEIAVVSLSLFSLVRMGLLQGLGAAPRFAGGALMFEAPSVLDGAWRPF